MSSRPIRAPHAPVKCFWPRAAHPGNILTDRRITHYIRQGVYGQDRRQRQLDRDTTKKPTLRTSAKAKMLELF